jgi:hypothetical protein
MATMRTTTTMPAAASSSQGQTGVDPVVVADAGVLAAFAEGVGEGVITVAVAVRVTGEVSVCVTVAVAVDGTTGVVDWSGRSVGGLAVGVVGLPVRLPSPSLAWLPRLDARLARSPDELGGLSPQALTTRARVTRVTNARARRITAGYAVAALA